VTCPDAATDLGAYVVGALEPAERRRVEEHLRHCPACAAELTELSPLPGLLDRVGPDLRGSAVVTPSPGLFARISAAAEPPRRRSHAWALVAAALLAVLGVGAGVAVWTAGSGEQSVTASAGALRATVAATEVDGGSALDVAVAGMRPGEACTMVAVDSGGIRHQAGAWPASAAGDGAWRGWAPVTPADLAAVVLLGDGGRELVRVPF
jgi:anti-sigma factor RsiW